MSGSSWRLCECSHLPRRQKAFSCHKCKVSIPVWPWTVRLFCWHFEQPVKGVQLSEQPWQSQQSLGHSRAATAQYNWVWSSPVLSRAHMSLSTSKLSRMPLNLNLLPLLDMNMSDVITVKQRDARAKTWPGELAAWTCWAHLHHILQCSQW